MALIIRDGGYTYAPGTTLEQPGIVDVTLAIEPGRLVLIAGETGSGKSTLLRVASGLITPDTGVAELNGAPIRPGDVGVVFQHPESQLFAETVAEDVAFGPKNAGVESERIDALVESSLRAVGLDADRFGSVSPFSLSGGEARRVAIAGVLALQTEYVLFDEPTAGLDARGRTAVVEIVQQLVRAGRGVAVVTHATEEFLGIADELVLMQRGRVAAHVPAREAVTDPEVFDRAGILPPPVLDTMRRVRDRSYACLVPTLDPHAAAVRILEQRGSVK